MFTAALVLGGSLIYTFSANSNAGALMIAAGCAIEVVKIADRVWKWIKA